MTENVGHQGHRRPLVDELLPKSAALIEAFRGDPDVALPRHPLVPTAEELAAHHRRQWAAEDDSRAAIDADAVARAKRLIDELNARRVELVEQIDRWVAAETTARPEASLHTETLGSVIDRLAIAWVRANHLTTATGDLQLARDALRQLAEMAGAYDDLVRDLAAGRRRLPTWRSLKRYGAGR
jgi:hypothetical protein